MRINPSWSIPPHPSQIPPPHTHTITTTHSYCSQTQHPAPSARPEPGPDIWLGLRRRHRSRSRSARRLPPPRGALPRRSSCQPPPCWQASPGRQPAQRAPAATAALPSPAELGAPGSASSSRATSPRLTSWPAQGSGPRTLPGAPHRPEPPQKPGTLRPSLSFFFSCVYEVFFLFLFFSPLIPTRFPPSPSTAPRSFCARVSVCALGARPLCCLGFPGAFRSGLGSLGLPLAPSSLQVSSWPFSLGTGPAL